MISRHDMMKLEIDVVSSVSIKRKKPWPKLAWIGKEQEGIFLLDERRVSQLYIPSGKTKKKIPKLNSFINDVCAVNVSQCGQYLIGILYEGKVFLWEKDNDIVTYISGLPKLFNPAEKENAKNKIFLSPCGKFLLVMVGFKRIFLWQKDDMVVLDDTQERNGTWCQIHRGEYILPDLSNKETAVDGVFYYDQVIGSCGAFSYVFNQGTNLSITTLNIKYHGATSQTDLIHDLTNQNEEIIPREVTEQTRFSIKWCTLTRPLYHITPATRLVKGRFVYVCRYSPDGQVLAVVLNQKYAKDTRLLFCSPLHGTMTIADLKCCGGSEQSNGRAWWVSEIVWTKDSLLLLGVTRNGALFITSKLGEPINLVTSGCMMNMGPHLFLSLHPRITVQSFQENIPPDNSEISSGSERDVFHQKFSVAVHPHLPVFLCSDGYIVTILQFAEKPGYAELMTNMVEQISRLIPKNQQSNEPILTPGILKKSPDDPVIPYSTVLSNMATPQSENSSPGSTLSTSLPGLGVASHAESGVVIFGDVGHDTKSEPETEQEKYIKAKNLLLQALGIGTCCGSHWCGDMSVVMNLVIHVWAKLFCCLLEHECQVAEYDNTVSFHKIISFVESVLDIFHWDMSYQHCLPWLSQVASSAVKSLVTFKKFDHNEVITMSLRLLAMLEACVRHVYTWCSLSNRCSVHLLGDRFVPACEASPCREQSPNTTASSPSNTYLECKLERSWLVLHSYVCKIYQSGSNPGEHLTQKLCLIQEKLQNINSLRNLVSNGKDVSPFHQGEQLYLEGNVSRAVNILRKLVDSSTQKGKSKSPEQATASKSIFNDKSHGLVKDNPGGEKFDVPSQVNVDTEALLTILHMHLENYNLRAALVLAYSYLSTHKPESVENCLYDGNSMDKGPLLFSNDGSEARITSSSPSVQLQLLLLTRYPLAWVTDSCALPVIQHLARFMCCYFTNLPLTIPVPFHGNQATLHQGRHQEEIIENKMPVGKMKTLFQQQVTDAVSKQKLGQCWTADHAIELLIVAGLLDEAAWFSERLGDWKIAFFLSFVQEFHKTCCQDFYQLPRSQCLFPLTSKIVHPKELILAKIKLILHLNEDWFCVSDDSESSTGENVSKSLRRFFQASVFAGLDVVPDCIENLLAVLLENIRSLGWLVPHDFYLPAPPLYCPQPTRNEEEVISEQIKREILARNEIAKIVQKIILILRSSNCFLWCAQAYCQHVATRANNDDDALPSVVKEFLASDIIIFDQGKVNQNSEAASSSSSQDYPVSAAKILQSFQQFCGLMWLLHVRDNVSVTSRAYSKLKQTLVVGEDDGQKEVVIHKCYEALQSLERMLPFADFLCATHDIQDGMLTLLTELPLTTETVDMLAKYFHNPSELVGLAIADKLKRLTRRLKNIPESSKNVQNLFTIYQEKCKAQRNEANRIVQNHELQSGVFSSGDALDYCSNGSFEATSEFVQFLDTFLLISVSKNITKNNRREIPLILCCEEELELTMLPGKVQIDGKSHVATITPSKLTKSPGLQRSQSFHDMRTKGRLGPHQSDNNTGNMSSPLYRSNSLTDITKDKDSQLSIELQAILPRLTWLQKWCSMEENESRTKGLHKNVSLLNDASGAIRVQVSLKMVLNTLWLLENYYKEFAFTSKRCSKNGSRKRRKRPKLSVEKSGRLENHTMEDQEKKKHDVQGTSEEKESGDGVGGEESTVKIPKNVEKKPERQRKEKRRAGTKEALKEDENVQKELATDKLQADRSSLERLGTVTLPRNEGPVKVDINESFLKESTEGYHETISDLVRDHIVANNIERKVVSGEISGKKKRTSRRKQHRNENGDTSGATLISCEAQPCIVVEDVDARDRSLGANGSSGQPKRIFPSSSSISSLDNNRQHRELGKFQELPLLSLDLSPKKMVSTEEGNKHPNGSLDDDSISPSSESLSVGQLRGEYMVFDKHGSTYSSTSASVGPGELKKRNRKPVKRKTSVESSEKSSQVAPKDEATLLRRIIRSEMRKFIKAQQAQVGSHSSTVLDTTEEDDVAKEKFIKNERSSKQPSQKKQYEEKNSKKNSKAHLKKSSSRHKVKNDAAPEGLSNFESLVEDPVSTTNNLGNGTRTTTHEVTRADGYPTNDGGSYPSNHIGGYPPNVSSSLPPRQPPYPNQEWPFWFQPPYAIAPPWLWPNTAAMKTNDDKSVQVSVVDRADDFDKENIRQPEVTSHEVEERSSKLKKSSVSVGADQKVQSQEHRSGTTSHIGVQTEANNRNLDVQHRLETSYIEWPTFEELRKTENTAESAFETGLRNDKPVLLQFDEEVLKEDPAYTSSEKRRNEPKPEKSDCNVDPRNVPPPDVMASTTQESLTIPLLKIPSEFVTFNHTKLPFKIAWPDTCLEPEATKESCEMPLLKFENDKQQGDETKFVGFSAPVRNFESVDSLPLLNLSQQQDSLSNFRLLDVSANQHDTFPLLQLPDMHEPRWMFPMSTYSLREDDKPETRRENGVSFTRSSREGKQSPKHILEVSEKTSQARLKRRELLKDNAMATKDKGRSDKRAAVTQHAGTSRLSHEAPSLPITIKPLEKRAKDPAREKKPAKRREKLRELNNILRELERGVSDDSDLVLSEVSDFLGDEVKYENFEKKSKRTPGTISKDAVDPADRQIYKMNKPLRISNIYKSSDVTAHEIHSSFPSTIPVEPMSSDVKVGTVNVPQLPVAVQTSPANTPRTIPATPKSHIPVSIQTEVPYPNERAPLEVSHPTGTTRQSQTKEFSVQTEMNEPPEPTVRAPLVRDAEMNTENIALVQPKVTVQSRYPCLPPDVYLNAVHDDDDDDDDDEVIDEGGLPLSSRQDIAQELGRGKQRKFISVADMAHEAVQRQIEEQRTPLATHKKQEKKYFPEEMENVADTRDVQSPTPDVVLLSPPSQNTREGDSITRDILSPPASLPTRVLNERDAQKIAKATVSRQFQEMNDHFEVIDRLASNMDKELQRSNMLLRTIDNLNKISDDGSSQMQRAQGLQRGGGLLKGKDLQVADSPMRYHQPTTRGGHVRQNMEVQDVQEKDDLFKNEDPHLPDLRSRYPDHIANKRHIRKDRPWINKSIKELTDINDEEYKETENVVDEEDKGSENNDFVENTDHETLESEKNVSKGDKTPRSIISSKPSERRLSEDLNKSLTTLQSDLTPRSHIMASIISHGTANVSKEKLKDLVNAVTNKSAADLRGRDKTPLKQHELQEWMSKKRKLRHEQWKADLTQKREAEHVPFQSKSSTAGVTSSKKIKKEEKEREETRRTKKQEYTTERLTSAYGLLNEMLQEPVPKQRTPTYEPTRRTQRKTLKKTSRARVKANNRYKNKSPVTRAAPSPLTATRTIVRRADEERGLETSATVYDYDIEESARRFVTRKSYEMYQNKMSGSLSFDFEKGFSGRSDLLKMSFDSRVDELLDDISLPDSIDESKLNNLNSLLNGDSELRELLGDVIGHKGNIADNRNRDLLYSNLSSPDMMMRENSDRWQTKEPPRARVLHNERSYVPEIVDNLKDVDNFEVSDDVAALLAEAKAAVGDDFSGGSDVGDIDWSEVDNVLQEN